MTLHVVRHGKSRRLSSPKQLLHKPLSWGQGKWHSIASLWAYKRRQRKARKVAARNRRFNLQRGH